MGGSSSKTKTEVVMESLNEIMVSSMQRCSTSSNIEQIISVKGTGNVLSDVEMHQVYTSMLTCVNKTDIVSKLQNELTDKIKTYADSQSLALLGIADRSDAEVDNIIRSSVKNAVNVQTISEMVNNAQQKQAIYVEGVGNTLLKVNMKQIQSNIASSTQDLVANIDIVNKLTTDVDSVAKSKQQDPIANLLAGLSNLISGPMMWVAIMLIGGLAIMVYFLNTGAGQMILGEGISQVNNANDDDSDSDDEENPKPAPAPMPKPVQQPQPVQQPVQQPAPKPVQQPQPVSREKINLFSDAGIDGLPKLQETSASTSAPAFNQSSSASSSPISPTPPMTQTIRDVTQADVANLPKLA